MNALDKIIELRNLEAHERDSLVNKAQSMAADGSFYPLPEVLDKIRICEARIRAFNSSISVVELH